MAVDSSAKLSPDGLVGYWPLTSNEKDVSGNGLITLNHGVTFLSGNALFNGNNAFLEVPETPQLDLSTDDFTIAVQINLDRSPDDALGDIVSKFAPDVRRGFHLSVLNLTGVTSAHSNYRTVDFGVDDHCDPVWLDVGRPGQACFVCALAVYDGDLYAGTFEGVDGEAGHVYRYGGGDTWLDCGTPDPCNAITTLAVYDGRLYAGASRYKAGGSALEESSNQHQGGTVYRYEGGTSWSPCGHLGDADTAWAMAVHTGHLYAIPIYHQGMWRYDGGEHWTYCGTPGVRLMAIGVYDGHIYGAGNEGNKSTGVYRYEGDERWTLCGRLPGVDQVYSFVAHNGKLYAGTWPDATVFRYDSSNDWALCGRLGDEMEVMPMAVYNGKLYGGTLPLAEVYRYDSGQTWTRLTQLDTTPDVKYRRVWSMAVFQGKLFCGTLPSGSVHALEVGANVTHDRALSPGWHHIAAVRRQNRLLLFVDGIEVRASNASNDKAHNVSVQGSLLIGAGANDFFNGSMRHLRLYRRALSATDVASLAGL